MHILLKKITFTESITEYNTYFKIHLQLILNKNNRKAFLLKDNFIQRSKHCDCKVGKAKKNYILFIATLIKHISVMMA